MHFVSLLVSSQGISTSYFSIIYNAIHYVHCAQNGIRTPISSLVSWPRGLQTASLEEASLPSVLSGKRLQKMTLSTLISSQLHTPHMGQIYLLDSEKFRRYNSFAAVAVHHYDRNHLPATINDDWPRVAVPLVTWWPRLINHPAIHYNIESTF
jgi:hypothetical protein